MTSKLSLLAQQKSASQIQTMQKDSLQWLTKKISDLKNPGSIRTDIARERFRNTQRFVLGGMYFFYYSPKGKDDLPYYDKFPLIIPLERYTDGFLALNLHYLPLKYRILFLDKLFDYAIYDSNDELKRLRVTYDILSASRRFKEFRPCIKKYLYSHIQSKILAVQPNEWDIAAFLPIQQFRGATASTVWRDSLEEMENK
jgi:hypothetical protein